MYRFCMVTVLLVVVVACVQTIPTDTSSIENTTTIKTDAKANFDALSSKEKTTICSHIQDITSKTRLFLVVTSDSNTRDVADAFNLLREPVAALLSSLEGISNERLVPTEIVSTLNGLREAIGDVITDTVGNSVDSINSAFNTFKPTSKDAALIFECAN